MPFLHQYDYIFVIGLGFASLDAYNIGANDVANSFATSIASRSLTLRQACCLAGLCEFLGAVLVGNRVAGTIKNGIISLTAFQGNAGVEMLAFTCALAASATWLMIATRNSWPVSTTYSIVSALAGVGVALQGRDAVQWGWNDSKGLGAIWAGMAIAPAIAAGFAATIYLITKYAVLVRKNPLKKGLMFAPLYFFTVTVVLTLSIVYKGAPNLHLDKLSKPTTALAIVLTSVVVAVLSVIFWMPYVYAKVVKKDYTIRWYHFFYGPLLWKRPAPEPAEDRSHVPDYRVYGRDGSEKPVSPNAFQTPEFETKSNPEAGVEGHDSASYHQSAHQMTSAPLEELERDQHPMEGAWYLPQNLWNFVRYKVPRALTHGTRVDIHKLQQSGSSAERIKAMHAQTHQYENETEHMYSFLQVLTACTNSFAHGSNDTANAVGPFAAIYYVWSEGVVTPKNTPTPVWCLAFLAIILVIGLATYGYKIMSALGNRLTLMSPSRGFSMEMGSSITVLLASQYGIPVSTTMCITGATAGTGLASGGVKGINWRAFGWIFLGWVLTIPIAAVSAGCLMGIILNAPHF